MKDTKAMAEAYAHFCEIFHCDRRGDRYCCHYCKLRCKNHCLNDPARCEKGFEKYGTV